jgi:hypothetical protein
MNLLQRLALLAVIGVVLSVAIHHYTQPKAAANATASQAQ